MHSGQSISPTFSLVLFPPDGHPTRPRGHSAIPATSDSWRSAPRGAGLPQRRFRVRVRLSPTPVPSSRPAHFHSPRTARWPAFPAQTKPPHPLVSSFPAQEIPSPPFYFKQLGSGDQASPRTPVPGPPGSQPSPLSRHAPRSRLSPLQQPLSSQPLSLHRPPSAGSTTPGLLSPEGAFPSTPRETGAAPHCLSCSYSPGPSGQYGSASNHGTGLSASPGSRW